MISKMMSLHQKIFEVIQCLHCPTYYHPQTVIVTWIKANTNFDVSVSLWQQFTMVLSSLTHWIDLIKEWAVSWIV